RLRMARTQERERRARVLELAARLVVLARARADAAEVEAQHDRAELVQHRGNAVHDFVVHRAAVERMRMEHEPRERRRLAVVLLEQRLERTGRARDLELLESRRGAGATHFATGNRALSRVASSESSVAKLSPTPSPIASRQPAVISQSSRPSGVPVLKSCASVVRWPG